MRALALVAMLLVPSVLAAAPEDAPGAELIVTLREPMPLPDGALPLLVLHGFILPDATPAQAERLASDPRVERVDRAVPLAYAAEARLPSRAFTQLTRSDRTELDGTGVTVAVLDSGIDTTHPDLADRVRANVRLEAGRFLPSAGDPDGHGTHVAGVVAASGASSDGRWRGVAPGAELVGIDISSRFTTASAVLAYDWLLAQHETHDIRIVVNAWGRVSDGRSYDARDPVMRAIDRLADAGVVILFSASNHGPTPGSLSVEAMHPRVITVGGTDAAGVLMEYSSRGPVTAPQRWIKPDVVAPGDAVVGPRSAQALPREGDPTPLHTVYSGTSQAAPHVAGIVAMMLQARPDLAPDDVARALRASAIDLGVPGPDEDSGAGIVDAPDAIRVALGFPAERSSVLITGGSERYHDSSTLAPSPRRSFLDLVSRPEVVWESAFAVKPGTQRLHVDAGADGLQGMDVELVKDGRVIRALDLSEPEPGIWMLRLRAAVPLATTARATIDTDLVPNPARALEFDGRQPAAASPPPAALPMGTLLVGALAATALLAALWPRRQGN